jgi:hypothetical protein
VLAVWLALAQPHRPAPTRDAALVLAAVIAVVAVVHGGSWPTVLAVVVAGAAAAAAIVRLDATATREAAVAAGLGAAATAIGLAGWGFAEAQATGFAQISPATVHPNATAALALGLAAGSALAWRGGWLLRGLGVAGVGASLVLVVLTGSRGGLVGLMLAMAMLLLLALGRALALARRPLAGTITAAGGAFVLLIGLQSLLMAPERWADWWASMWATGNETVAEASPLSDLPLLERLARLRDPLGTSGGRLAAWKLAREMIAHRPVLGYGLDAVERVYAPGAASELSHPLSHPHHGVLTLVLQGGTLFAVAVLTLLAGLGLRSTRAAVRGDAVAAIAAAVLVGLIGAELLDSVVRYGNVGGPALVVLLLATATERHRPTKGDPDETNEVHSSPTRHSPRP